MRSSTIEKTFEALFSLVRELDEEESRAVREGLDEESLAIFDLLRKPDLNAPEIKRIKAVAVQLLERLKEEKLRVDHWRDNESTRDAVRVAIRDYLWDDATGLPVDAPTSPECTAHALKSLTDLKPSDWSPLKKRKVHALVVSGVYSMADQ